MVLCTHEHWDHLDGPAVAAVAAAAPDCRVVVPAPVTGQAVAAGVPADAIWWPGQEDVLRRLGVQVALLPINGRDPVREAANVVGNLDHREAALLAHAAGVDLLVPRRRRPFHYVPRNVSTSAANSAWCWNRNPCAASG